MVESTSRLMWYQLCSRPRKRRICLVSPAKVQGWNLIGYTWIIWPPPANHCGPGEWAVLIDGASVTCPHHISQETKEPPKANSWGWMKQKGQGAGVGGGKHYIETHWILYLFIWALETSRAICSSLSLLPKTKPTVSKRLLVKAKKIFKKSPS